MRYERLPKKRVLERGIENRACKEIVKLGGLTRKMNGLGNRSWPDRLIIGFGVQYYIEFKKPGEDPTPLQLKLHRELRKRGHIVLVLDNVEDAVRSFKKEGDLYGVRK
jgi:hypothetical protein